MTIPSQTVLWEERPLLQYGLIGTVFVAFVLLVLGLRILLQRRRAPARPKAATDPPEPRTPAEGQKPRKQSTSLLKVLKSHRQRAAGLTDKSKKRGPAYEMGMDLDALPDSQSSFVLPDVPLADDIPALIQRQLAAEGLNLSGSEDEYEGEVVERDAFGGLLNQNSGQQSVRGGLSWGNHSAEKTRQKRNESPYAGITDEDGI